MFSCGSPPKENPPKENTAREHSTRTRCPAVVDMKRRGGGTSTASEPRASNVVAADVDDKQLSAAAQKRIADKAAAEALGGTPRAAAAQPLPLGFIAAAVGAISLMLYFTLKFSG